MEKTENAPAGDRRKELAQVNPQHDSLPDMRGGTRQRRSPRTKRVCGFVEWDVSQNFIQNGPLHRFQSAFRYLQEPGPAGAFRHG
jgi:hypothetical protein